MHHSVRSVRLPVALAALLVAAGPLHAGIVPIPFFAGDVFDTFNQYVGNTPASQVLPVLQDTGTISNLTVDGAIKVEFSSNFNGDLVVPLSGKMMGQLGIARWDFDTPGKRFGAYFENNSGMSDATLTFFDINDQPIDTVIANVPVNAQSWTWNGWESDVPFKSILVVGNGVINGFIWYENVQFTFVPEPATGLAALGFAGVGLLKRRRMA